MRVNLDDHTEIPLHNASETNYSMLAYWNSGSGDCGRDNGDGELVVNYHAVNRMGDGDGNGYEACPIIDGDGVGCPYED